MGGRPCRIAEHADGIAFLLDPGDPDRRDVLETYRSTVGQTAPLHVLAPGGGGLGSSLAAFRAQVAMAAAARLADDDEGWTDDDAGAGAFSR